MTSPTASPETLGTILSIWAHPDDETYLAAGIMAAARDRGERVVCGVASAGELGTDEPDLWPPERLGRVRRWESAAAMAVLGIEEHHFADLPDGSLAAHDETGLSWVGRLLDEVRPDTILTFGPDGMTFHPDHVAVHRWVTRSWRERGCPGRLLYATATEERLDRFGQDYEDWGVWMTDERPAGVPVEQVALYVVLDGVDLDRKLTALRAMTTQTGALVAGLKPEKYAALVAEEAFVAASPETRGVEDRTEEPAWTKR